MTADDKAGARGARALWLAALGVVFGDIGTSPLYTLKVVVALAGGHPDKDAILGFVSLIIWTLIVIPTVKYVLFAMRINNNGEGGILALMSLVGIKRYGPGIVAAGLFGAALLYADGAITPAISVLSALEGLGSVAPSLAPYVVPLAVLILAGLFLVQPLGTARIGHAFGPVMAAWFTTIAVLGIGGILQYPAVLEALNPLFAIDYLRSSGVVGFLVLGGVFLCVTGAEALYADMGHFGISPIRFDWMAIVFPSLCLNYAGQAALVLKQGPASENFFYSLCPAPLLLPLIILATIATIIASQSVITGAFSMTRQAVRLGWLPHLHITQTSNEGYGQIYVGAVNWPLMLVTIALTIAFEKSGNLAAAYGIAVSATMLLTTYLLFTAMREIWGWGLIASAAVAGIFLIVDSVFFLANMAKIAHGGYVPIMLAIAVYGVMYIWHRGVRAIAAVVEENLVSIGAFAQRLAADHVARVPGTAVFLTRSSSETPPVVAWYVSRAHALQEHVVAITIRTSLTPWVTGDQRLSLAEIAPDFWRADACYGFMERPDVQRLVAEMKDRGCRVDLSDTTYYVGLETVVARQDRKGLPHWMVKIFSAMLRNTARVTDEFNFPRDRVVELGRQVAI
jgi:KUP system potassium uptake protein